MRIRKSKFPKKALALIKSYKEKEPVEIKKIQVKWACGKNRNKATRRYRYAGGYRLFYVNLKALVGSADFGEMGYSKLQPYKLFNGVNERDYRVVQALDHWSQDGFIDPPEIYPDRQKVAFADGRHRTIAAYHLGKKEIPVYVHTEGIDEITNLIKLRRSRLLHKRAI